MLAIHRVETPEELRAVRQLRYRVYVEEGCDQEHHEADHERGLLGSATDEAPETRIYYVGSPGAMSATLRARSWQPGGLPDDMRSTYSMDTLPSMEDAGVSEFSSLVTDPSVRGSGAVVSLFARAFEDVIVEHHSALIFGASVLGLVRIYGRLGWHDYGGRPIPTSTGMILPLLNLCDVENSRKSRSPLSPLFERLNSQGKLSSFDSEPFRERVHGSTLVVDEETIAEEVALALATPGSTHRLIKQLGHERFEQLSARGVVLDIEAGVEVVRQNALDRDLYIVLEGALEVRSKDQYRATLVAGDSFGEVALSSANQRRSASVFTVVPSRLLVIPTRPWSPSRRVAPR